jgi:hypothetical protein
MSGTWKNEELVEVSKRGIGQKAYSSFLIFPPPFLSLVIAKIYARRGFFRLIDAGLKFVPDTVALLKINKSNSHF